MPVEPRLTFLPNVVEKRRIERVVITGVAKEFRKVGMHDVNIIDSGIQFFVGFLTSSEGRANTFR